MEQVESFWLLVAAFLAKLEPRDWITLVGLCVAFVTFWWKLKTDSAAARYRETIAYLDKHTKDLDENFNTVVKAHEQDKLEIDAAKKLFALLETAALLIQKKAFDHELIYNRWWRYFVAPMELPKVKVWLNELRDDDAAIYVHYCHLEEKWRRRVAKEKTNGLTKFKLKVGGTSQKG